MLVILFKGEDFFGGLYLFSPVPCIACIQTSLPSVKIDFDWGEGGLYTGYARDWWEQIETTKEVFTLEKNDQH